MNIRGSVAYTERQLARDAAQQAEAKLLTGSRRLGGTITTDGCSADQIAELTKWDIDAWDKIRAARACTKAGCATLVPLLSSLTGTGLIGNWLQVDTWFGPSTTQTELNAITAKFDVMASIFQYSIYRCEPDCTPPCGCDGNTYAVRLPVSLMLYVIVTLCGGSMFIHQTGLRKYICVRSPLTTR